MSYREGHYYGLTQVGGQHKIYYSDWGPEDGRPIICVHGLTGNGFDFDYIAPALVKDGYRVIAIDMPGRGRSDFHKDPLDYNYDQYVQDLHELLSHLDMQEPACVDWLGVSLGGLLGIRMAALENSPIARLILNDIGPTVPKAALDFIYNVVKPLYTFDTIADLETRMRQTRGQTWGPVTDEQWNHMARHNARALDDGQITYAYDHLISEVFESSPIGDMDLWACWSKINQPTLVLQGANSMLLTADILKEMETRGSGFDLIVFEGCGHVPSLMAPNQIDVIKTWLNDTQI